MKASWGDYIRSGGVREKIEDGKLKLYISGDFPGLQRVIQNYIEGYIVIYSP